MLTIEGVGNFSRQRCFGFRAKFRVYVLELIVAVCVLLDHPILKHSLNPYKAIAVPFKIQSKTLQHPGRATLNPTLHCDNHLRKPKISSTLVKNLRIP